MVVYLYINIYSYICIVKVKKEIDPRIILRVAELLKTIGHPIRLQVLQALAAYEPLSVNELQQELGDTVEQSLLSHHLIKMKDRGLLQSEKKGMNVYYTLKDRKILKIFECLNNCDLV